MKFQLVGEISQEHKELIQHLFTENGLQSSFEQDDIVGHKCISLCREASAQLEKEGVSFYNWDLLFSTLGPNDTSSDLKAKIIERIKILKSLQNITSPQTELEFHGSIRVSDLSQSCRFYTWLFGVPPKEWTHRYVTFHRRDTKFNFVLLVSDGKELNHDTLYHLGMGVESKNKVIEFYHSAQSFGFHIEKPPRTTWRGTPLHEMWLKDPDGTLIEIYARLTPDELELMPNNKEPFDLV